jgi:hypothetical protein
MLRGSARSSRADGAPGVERRAGTARFPTPRREHPHCPAAGGARGARLRAEPKRTNGQRILRWPFAALAGRCRQARSKLLSLACRRFGRLCELHQGDAQSFGDAADDRG